MAGVVALTLRLLGGWLLVRRLTRQARPLAGPCDEVLARLARALRIRRAVRLLESSLVQVPMVIGGLRPMILLPIAALTGLPPGQLEALLAHELAHIRRHDYLVNLVQSAIEVLLFYHPAAWWASRVIRAEREHCCDDLAVRACGDRLTYARALAAMEGLRGAPRPVPGGLGRPAPGPGPPHPQSGGRVDGSIACPRAGSRTPDRRAVAVRRHRTEPAARDDPRRATPEVAATRPRRWGTSRAAIAIHSSARCMCRYSARIRSRAMSGFT